MRKSFIVAGTCSIITIIAIGLFTNGAIKHQKQIEHKLDKISSKQESIIAGGHATVTANIPIKRYAGKFKASFYCPCAKCVGEKKIVRTSTGNLPYPHKTIAVDKNVIPLHSIVYIKGLGFYVADDTGGDIKGNRIDIFVNNHQEALKLGTKTVEVYILE